jgi:2-hydroxychromene-2-carboxylate isomerase
MGDVIQLVRRRPVPRDRAGGVTFFFDLACPYTYLAAERLDRRFCGARWRPAAGRHLAGSPLVVSARAHETGIPDARAMRTVELRARELHMPLVWPDRFPAQVPHAMRAATYAAERGRVQAFAIAVGRLAFCGGFDVEDPRMLAEAAAAAGLDVDETLDAVGEEWRDREIEAAGRALWVDGGTTLPAVRHDGGLFCGEHGVTAAIFALPAVVNGWSGR